MQNEIEAKKSAEREDQMKSLPAPVQEAIDAYGKYYAKHHKLGMSVRDDMTYIAHMAMRWTKPNDVVEGSPDGINLQEQIAHMREIYSGDISTFGQRSLWAIKSGSVLASLIELQDARATIAALELEAADLRSCIKDLRERLAKAREEVMQEWAATFERDADGYAATGFTEDHYCVAVRRECARQLRMCIADEAELRALKQKGADHE